MQWNQETRLHSEEYNTHRLAQSEAPLKYILSGPREGFKEFSKRTFHHVGHNDVDRPVLTNLNELPDYNTPLVSRSALKTRHVFQEEIDKETFLRPSEASHGGPMDFPIDRFNMSLLHVQYPSEDFVRGGVSTRADLRNEVLNR